MHRATKKLIQYSVVAAIASSTLTTICKRKLHSPIGSVMLLNKLKFDNLALRTLPIDKEKGKVL